MYPLSVIGKIVLDCDAFPVPVKKLPIDEAREAAADTNGSAVISNAIPHSLISFWTYM